MGNGLENFASNTYQKHEGKEGWGGGGCRRHPATVAAGGGCVREARGRENEREKREREWRERYRMKREGEKI